VNSLADRGRGKHTPTIKIPNFVNMDIIK